MRFVLLASYVGVKDPADGIVARPFLDEDPLLAVMLRLGEGPDDRAVAQRGEYLAARIEPGVKRCPGGVTDGAGDDLWRQRTELAVLLAMLEECQFSPVLRRPDDAAARRQADVEGRAGRIGNRADRRRAAREPAAGKREEGQKASHGTGDQRRFLSGLKVRTDAREAWPIMADRGALSHYECRTFRVRANRCLGGRNRRAILQRQSWRRLASGLRRGWRRGR